MTRAFKRYGTAKDHANGRPILRVGCSVNALYIVGLDLTDEISLLANDGRGTITGHITLKHLDRLGNGNWATSKNGKDYSFGRAFPENPQA